MSSYIVELPDSAPAALGVDAQHVAAELRLAAAMKLYELQRVSAGGAAEFAGISVPEFLSRLADFGVAAFRQSPEELDRELASARRR